jgi:hypothetical protein
MSVLGRKACIAYHEKAAPWHSSEELEQDYDHNLSKPAWDAAAQAVKEDVTQPFKRMSETDWKHLYLLLGHDEPWKEVLSEFRAILEEEDA